MLGCGAGASAGCIESMEMDKTTKTRPTKTHRTQSIRASSREGQKKQICLYGTVTRHARWELDDEEEWARETDEVSRWVSGDRSLLRKQADKSA
jgi:hypothetical protein